MNKILENVERITTKAEFELLTLYLDNLIIKATKDGHLKDPHAQNEYTKEIGRLTILAANYEAEYMEFEFINPTPLLIRIVKTEMEKRNLRQREAAKLLNITEPALSRFLNGKRKLTFDFAQKLYKTFHIDPKLILEYE